MSTADQHFAKIKLDKTLLGLNLAMFELDGI